MYFKLVVSAVLLLVLSAFADDAREPSCGPNEVRTKCGSICPPTCQNPTSAATTCNSVCKYTCFCKPGYLRDERTKKCIPSCQCPTLPST